MTKLEPIQVLCCKHGRKRGAGLVTIYPDSEPQPGTSAARLRLRAVKVDRPISRLQVRSRFTNQIVSGEDPVQVRLRAERKAREVKLREFRSGWR